MVVRLNSVKVFLKHESERVYVDRLVKVEHLDKFKNALSDIAKKNFLRSL